MAKIQESARDLTAELLKCAPGDLERLPERASVKPGGCPELPGHLDLDRKGMLQTVFALSSTAFLVWPGSHHVQLHLPTGGLSVL